MKSMIHRRALEILHHARVFFPAVVPDLSGGGYVVFSAMKVLGQGETIEAAMADARSKGNIPDVPPPPVFRGHGKEVEIYGEVVAVAKSRVYADRIANALNVYNPNERGI